MCAINWDMAPQWLGLATGVVAATAFVASRRDLTRAHASSVYVLIRRYKFSQQRRGDEWVSFLSIWAHVANPALKPITECGVHIFAPLGHRRRLWWTSRRSRNWWTSERLAGRVYPSLAPRSTSQPIDEELQYKTVDIGSHLMPTVIIAFTDGNGRRWIRWPDGRISRYRRWLMRR